MAWVSCILLRTSLFVSTKGSHHFLSRFQTVKAADKFSAMHFRDIASVAILAANLVSAIIIPEVPFDGVCKYTPPYTILACPLSHTHRPAKYLIASLLSQGPSKN